MLTFKRKTILITGGTGLVGSHLIEALLLNKANIINISRTFDPYSYFVDKGLHHKVIQITTDLRDYNRLTDLVTKYQPHYIIHLAAQALVDVAYLNPVQTLETNIMGTAHVLQAARQSSLLRNIIIASSDKAYGKLEKKKYAETDPLKGNHPYEVSKSAADLIGQMYYRTYDMPVVITRFGNIYGPGDLNFSRLIPKLCRAIILKRIVRLRSDGTFIRDYLYVNDVVDGYLRIMHSGDNHVGESFNFGSPENLSVMQVIEQVGHVTGKKVHYKILNTQKNEIPRQSLQYTKATKLLGWKPRYHLTEGLRITYDWYRQYFAA